MESEDFVQFTESQKIAMGKWKGAKSFGDLCELMAQFCEGTLPYPPGYLGEQLDKESSSISDILVQLNRSGFLTTCSQPGETLDADKCGQRAFVMGFAGFEMAQFIEERLLFTRLYVARFYPFEPMYDLDNLAARRIPVTLQHGEPFTFVGHYRDDEFSHFREVLNDGPALEDLANATYLLVVDLDWNGGNYLFEQISKIAMEI